MKRDMELVRDLLFLIESQDSDHNELKIPSEIDREVAVYHLNIMEQAGFTDNTIQYADNKPMWIYSSLTWDGHDFLDSIKNDTVWNKIKSGVKSKGLELGQLSFSVLKEYAKLELKKKLGME
ncbi:DUF2513 domain-containing protein [Niallia sp. NCCP-28]|uniref:DUF2513 domain-containing protein n=1 Tax=Niallia sp. NCCP-28 TaxID=2934712 RepID=UPI0020840152|nr:DUF2513 domain-containing protein [Niallia sp. NCCP-28]GKU82915.1 hypothetical protein NCCP28_23110 [Niallia sp. NCCP-28]